MSEEWDKKLVGLANYIGSEWSKDPSTKVGCVLANDRHVLVVHAEVNAVLNATQSLVGTTAYNSLAPCSDCMKLMINAGIKRVVFPKPSADELERWGESFELASDMADEAGVEMVQLSTPPAPPTPMTLDHIAYRVKDRLAAVEWHVTLGYREETVFVIDFDDGSKATCSVMIPEEGPEVFISQGTPGSIVDRWVDAHGGVGAVHHTAYRVDDVGLTMAQLGMKGVKFLSDKPLTCPGLVQVFTKPDPRTGIIYEFIERESQGFCQENVKDLMISTDEEKPHEKS